MNTKGIELSEQMLQKLDNIESLEELKALVKEVGLEVADEELAEYFDEDLKAFKLPEKDLERVAGGGGKVVSCKVKCCGKSGH